MAVATSPVIGKRKRENGTAMPVKSKKPAFKTGPQQQLARDRVSARVAQVEAQDSPTHEPQPEPQMAPQTQTKPKRSLKPSMGDTALDQAIHVQIVTGSYERVLHGFSAKIPRQLLQAQETTSAASGDSTDNKVAFSDTFLFAAHASSIRCLALSPPTESDKRYLATGSSDERINVYSVSTVPPKNNSKTPLPSLSINSIAENPRNRSLGSLIHHDRAVTHLEFPAKGKLFSAAEDNTIAISRTRDWTMLSSIKAPIPKPQGRPSGDTAGPGETPAGVNDFAIHPSQKLMLSVGRGERSLRLWNLMTGKKAGVLNFDRELLSQVGEGRHGSGEGRQVVWNQTGGLYVVAFERGAAVFGVDSKPKAVIKPSPPTKLHQLRTVQLAGVAEPKELLAVSTEDGRILFYDIDSTSANDKDKLPSCTCVAQLGGRDADVTGRIKDFEILGLPTEASDSTSQMMLVVTAGSDGAVRVWLLPANFAGGASAEKEGVPQQVGQLVGTLETGNRITCLGAFVMDGKNHSDAGNGDDDAEFGGFEDEDQDEAEDEEESE